MSYAGRLLRRALRAIPQSIIHQFLSVEDKFAAWGRLVDACERFNITTLSAKCDLGLITGSPKDRTIFQYLVLGFALNSCLTDKFRTVLANGGTYIDIGANIGLTTLLSPPSSM
jgi:hypothetical protein